MTGLRRTAFWIALAAVVALVSLGRYYAGFLLFVVAAVPAVVNRLARYQRSLDMGPPDSGSHYGANHYRP